MILTFCRNAPDSDCNSCLPDGAGDEEDRADGQAATLSFAGLWAGKEDRHIEVYGIIGVYSTLCFGLSELSTISSRCRNTCKR